MLVKNPATPRRARQARLNSAALSPPLEKPAHPALTKYLKYSDVTPALIPKQAAEQGDVELLDFLLYSVPQHSLTKLTALKLELQKIQQNYDHFFRRKEVIELQKDLWKKIFSKYGAKIIHHLDEYCDPMLLLTQELLYKYRAVNRLELANCQPIFVQGEEIKPTLELKIPLHKQFSNGLEKEFQEAEVCLDVIFDNKVIKRYTAEDIRKQGQLNPNNVFQLQTLVSTFNAKIQSAYDTAVVELNNAGKELESCLTKIKTFEESIEKEGKNAIDIKRSFILAALYEKHEAQPDFKRYAMRSKFPQVLSLPITWVNSLDSSSNTPLHSALMAGQFEAALHLLALGANPLIKNNDDVKAIDAKDANGDTLVLYLTRQHDSQSVCKYIQQGADYTAANHSGETIYNTGNCSSLHQLFLQLRSKSRHEEAIDYFFEKHFSYSLLDIEDKEGKKVIEVMATLPNETKQLLCSKLRRALSNRKFVSCFQLDLHYAMMRHFFKLIERPGSNNNDLNFICYLELELLAAEKTYIDSNLVLLLNREMQKPAAKEFRSLYERHVIKAQEERKKGRSYAINGQHAAGSYFIDEKGQTRAALPAPAVLTKKKQHSDKFLTGFWFSEKRLSDDAKIKENTTVENLIRYVS